MKFGSRRVSHHLLIRPEMPLPRALRLEGSSVGASGTVHAVKHLGWLYDDEHVAWELAQLVTAVALMVVPTPSPS